MPTSVSDTNLPLASIRCKRRRRVITALIIVALLAYVLPLVALAMNQDQLIYYPEHYAAGSWTQADLPVGMDMLSLRTRDQGTVAAVFATALSANGRPDSAARVRPTLLYLHGNTADLRSAINEVKILQGLDMNVLAVDYAGFGISRRAPSEQGCVEAAEAGYSALLARPHMAKPRIVIIGHSLGGGVAVELARLEEETRIPPQALALISTFTSIADEGHAQYPIYPAWMMNAASRTKFDSIATIAQVHCPIFIAHSRHDELIPYAMSGEMARAAGGPVTRLSFDHVHHGDEFSVGASQVLPPLRAWIERVTGAASRDAAH